MLHLVTNKPKSGLVADIMRSTNIMSISLTSEMGEEEHKVYTESKNG